MNLAYRIAIALIWLAVTNRADALNFPTTGLAAASQQKSSFLEAEAAFHLTSPVWSGSLPTSSQVPSPSDDPFLAPENALQLAIPLAKVTTHPLGNRLRSPVVLRGYITGHYDTIDHYAFLRNQNYLAYARKTGQSVRGKVEGLTDMNQKNVVVSVRRAGWAPDLIKTGDLVDVAGCTADGTFQINLLEPGDYVVTAEVETLDPATHQIAITQKGTTKITLEKDKALPPVKLSVEPIETR
ncbi:MAG TPA: hypothetical protein VHD56_12135 [Tepidisphaeraceae bacterium]|nr:hypothetical protein [Tepidisphaeraceae bacterium]